MVTVDPLSPLFIVPVIVGSIGFAIYIAAVIINARLVSQNKMSGTIIGKLISRLGIAWMLAGITSVIVGMAWYLEMEYNLLVIGLMIFLWFIGAILVLDAITKWKKEMK